MNRDTARSITTHALAPVSSLPESVSFLEVTAIKRHARSKFIFIISAAFRIAQAAMFRYLRTIRGKHQSKIQEAFVRNPSSENPHRRTHDFSIMTDYFR